MKTIYTAPIISISKINADDIMTLSIEIREATATASHEQATKYQIEKDIWL